MATRADNRVMCGDVGAILRLGLYTKGDAVDLTALGVTSTEIRIYRPDGTAVTRAATYTTNGTDGQIQVATIATDTAPGGADLPGRYRYRAHIVGPTLDRWTNDAYFYAERVL